MEESSIGDANPAINIAAIELWGRVFIKKLSVFTGI